jgi:hypothetical protein
MTFQLRSPLWKPGPLFSYTFPLRSFNFEFTEFFLLLSHATCCPRLPGTQRICRPQFPSNWLRVARRHEALEQFNSQLTIHNCPVPRPSVPSLFYNPIQHTSLFISACQATGCPSTRFRGARAWFFPESSILNQDFERLAFTGLRLRGGSRGRKVSGSAGAGRNVIQTMVDWGVGMQGAKG